jgi:hypothetical protein
VDNESNYYDSPEDDVLDLTTTARSETALYGLGRNDSRTHQEELVSCVPDLARCHDNHTVQVME